MKIKLSIGIIIVVIVGGIFIISRPTKDANYEQPYKDNTEILTTENIDVNTTETIKAYSMDEVMMHKDTQSCWTVVNGNVYDVTTWINQHPGGPEKILFLCGKDGTSNFTNKHSGQEKPEAMLQSFKIGQIK